MVDYLSTFGFEENRCSVNIGPTQPLQQNFYFLRYFLLNGGFEPISTSFDVTDKISIGYWGG